MVRRRTEPFPRTVPRGRSPSRVDSGGVFVGVIVLCRDKFFVFGGKPSKSSCTVSVISRGRGVG